MVPGARWRGRAAVWWESVNSALDSGADKKLFEVKRKDQMNALKNLIELNDINQQYKIIDIMLKGLFKVSHSAGCTLCPQGWAEMGRVGGFCGVCGLKCEL